MLQPVDLQTVRFAWSFFNNISQQLTALQRQNILAGQTFGVVEIVVTVQISLTDEEGRGMRSPLETAN